MDTDKIKIECQCGHCQAKETIVVDEQDYINWKENGQMAEYLSELTAAQREMLISRTCDNCWKRFYPE